MPLDLNVRADITLDTYRRVAWDRETVALGTVAMARVTNARTAFMHLIDSDPNLTI